ncbi:MAG: hypothetical protein LQ342_000948 [Letrouitia transgressa]|nr:MAG: hypothetical protein LQ342_000948 [Letrouitia transgressa]
MSDDEPEEELLSLLRQSLGLHAPSISQPPETKVLESASFVYDHSLSVAIDSQSTKAAAASIWKRMQEKNYSLKSWSEHDLHPKSQDAPTVDFIFLMDLLNFSFWSDSPDPAQRFSVEYRGKQWTGYWSLVAALQRALDDGIPITNPPFWLDEKQCTLELWRHVFRSATHEPIPLLAERVESVREAGRVLRDRFDDSFRTCIERADRSAAALVNLLVAHFPCFNDVQHFEGREVRFYKRAQILVADLWACFEGESYGEFRDIDTITMFADYRVPQMLHQLGCLRYSPNLEKHIRELKVIGSGDVWEVELRGCSIWCVELIKREILREHGEKAKGVNAILVDFFLYDTVKEMERDGQVEGQHHRTRSIWY